MDETIKKLSEKLSSDAVQRTKKENTRKAYDTDGYGYQFAVDRFNETLGAEWGFKYQVIRDIEGQYKSGQVYHDITVEVSIWVRNPEQPRTCAGGHISASYADALKGAITNGFKKAAAFWGVGRDAYAGTIDDDNKPMPDVIENIDHGAAKKDAAAKLAALPDNIKAGFKAMGFTGKDAFDVCNRNGWDTEKIAIELSKIADKGAA